MSAARLAEVLNVAADLNISISQEMLWKWVERGKVRRYGRDSYDIDDVAREAQRVIRSTVELDEDSKPCHGSTRRGVSAAS